MMRRDFVCHHNPAGHSYSSPEALHVVSRRLTDYRMYVYGSLAYLEKATPIVTMQDLKNHPLCRFLAVEKVTDHWLPRIGGAAAFASA
jgi:hypothetical protein